MLKVAVYNQEGKQVKDTELNELVFGIEPNNQAIFDMVLLQRASWRQGTHKVKNRTEVRGGGRKPWRQRVQVELDKDLSALHNGEVGELYLVLHQEAIHLS